MAVIFKNVWSFMIQNIEKEYTNTCSMGDGGEKFSVVMCIPRAQGANEKQAPSSFKQKHEKFPRVKCAKIYIFVIHNFNQHNFRWFRSSITLALNFTLFSLVLPQCDVYLLVQSMQMLKGNLPDTHTHFPFFSQPDEQRKFVQKESASCRQCVNAIFGHNFYCSF